MIFKSFLSRRRKPVSRIHIELTAKSKERLASITSFADSHHIESALKELQDEAGFSKISKYIISNVYGIDTKKTHNNLIEKAEQELIFSYLEHFFRITFNSLKENGLCQTTRYYGSDFFKDLIKKIENIFTEEGILWELQVKKDKLNDLYFQFNELSSVMQKESDEELQLLYLGTEWEESLKPYSMAYEIFLSGSNSFEIPEKLYNSFEMVVKKICLDNGWETNGSLKIANYLNKLKEKGIFDQNKIMPTEIEDLLKSMEKTISKIGGDRKRHINMDKYFCNLLLHQSSAWLVYIIKKYSEFKKNEKS